MNANEVAVAEDVQRWQAEGLWIDCGLWVRAKAKWGAVEYWPTQREIIAKCRLLRTRDGRHGAHARAPRGGEFAIATTAGV